MSKIRPFRPTVGSICTATWLEPWGLHPSLHACALGIPPISFYAEAVAGFAHGAASTARGMGKVGKLEKVGKVWDRSYLLIWEKHRGAFLVAPDALQDRQILLPLCLLIIQPQPIQRVVPLCHPALWYAPVALTSADTWPRGINPGPDSSPYLGPAPHAASSAPLPSLINPPAERPFDTENAGVPAQTHSLRMDFRSDGFDHRKSQNIANLMGFLPPLSPPSWIAFTVLP